VCNTRRRQGAAQRLLYEGLNPELTSCRSDTGQCFRGKNRSMRDVEPWMYTLWVKTLTTSYVEAAE